MPEILHNAVFIQAVGFIACVLGIAAFLSHHDRKLKILLIIQSLTLSLHFFLLGAGGATVATLVSAIRNFAALFAKLKRLAPFFILVYVVFGIYQYREWTDILPITSAIINTVAVFYLQKVPMRLCMLVATSLWIIHNAAVVSLGPLLMELFIFTANVRTIRSLRKKS